MKQILPDISRVAPTRYVTRVRGALVDINVGLVRVVLLGLVTGGPLGKYARHAGELMIFSRDRVGDEVRASLFSVSLRGVGLLLVCAVISYGWSWWRFIKSHRMSYEELKNEHKESEGDPHFRAARRHEHQALSMAEMERRVRNAKVLVVRRRPRLAR